MRFGSFENVTLALGNQIMRIVIADQNDRFLEPFQCFLRSQGHKAAIASDGLSCLNALREWGPDVLAIGSHLQWGGSEGVLSVMLEDEELRHLPVMLLQGEGEGFGLRRHPMIAASARPPFRFEDLACQLNFLAILDEDEKCRGVKPKMRFVANAVPTLENAIWNA
ncbi:MAG: hypothetical protein ACK6DC_03700 [Planctomycetota bacterium]|jgi:CheY-like chemotaxis protein